MIKAVFFDLDGTLCDSDTAWSIAQSETFQLLRKQYPDISEETLAKAWSTVHQRLFQQLDAGKCAMADVRDSRFPDLFKELGLPPRSNYRGVKRLFEFTLPHEFTSLRRCHDP